MYLRVAMQIHKKKPFEGKKNELTYKEKCMHKNNVCIKNKNLYNLQVQVDLYLGAMWYICCSYIYIKTLTA